MPIYSSKSMFPLTGMYVLWCFKRNHHISRALNAVKIFACICMYVYKKLCWILGAMHIFTKCNNAACDGFCNKPVYYRLCEVVEIWEYIFRSKAAYRELRKVNLIDMSVLSLAFLKCHILAKTHTYTVWHSLWTVTIDPLERSSLFPGLMLS